jgi:GNAT superfamily N-acetyltransferase
MRLRDRRDEDMEACVRLLRATHEADGYPRLWPRDPERFIRSRHETRAWIVEQGGVVLGHVALHDVATEQTLDLAHATTSRGADELTVVARLLASPRHRRRGLGTRLVGQATDAAHRLGRQPVLEVDNTLAAAVALYDTLGWRRVGDFRLEAETVLDIWVYVGPEPG